MTSHGMNGENGTKKPRSYQKSSQLTFGPVSERKLVQPIRELRKTIEGKAELNRTNRDKTEQQRRPGAVVTRRFVAWDGEGITRTKRACARLCAVRQQRRNGDKRTILANEGLSRINDRGGKRISYRISCGFRL